MNARRWILALTPLLLAGVATPVVSAPAPTAPIVRVAEPTTSFSPNGDGRQDRARIRFSVDRAALVTVVVKREGELVRGPERLGRLGAGRHAWTWDGTRTSGRPVADGTFTVVVRAASGGRYGRAVVTTYVDRVADAGRLVTTRSTVYPKASVVSDHVAITYLREGWNAEEAATQFGGAYETRPVLDVRLTVVDGSGRTVWQRLWTPRYGWWQDGGGLTFGFAWYARGPGGAPVPEGTYAARLRVRDPAGNESTFSAPLTVSYQQLKPALWTTTVPAASATRYTPAGCTACTQGCFPVASDRFAGGLSFRACPGNDSTRAWFSAAPPVLAAPADSYRITATGGPTTPGTDDVGSVSGYRSIGPGDATASTPWLSPGLEVPPYLPDQHTAVTWGFSTSNGDSYDIASFTVDYRYYVPVS